MKVLAFKELREVFGIAAVALGCYLALVANLMGARVFDWVPGMPTGTQEVPFTGDDFLFMYVCVSVVFAVALGLRQTALESSRGTFLFLLHRPLPRGGIMLTKVATGFAVFLACASVPILLYGWWASVPGNHASPFEWSMTAPAWHVALAYPLLYVGAFLSGLRPARWFGTRLLPLAASAVLLYLLEFQPGRGVAALPVAAVSYALLAANVCHVARVRDYA
jgi:hypothetical protein